MKKRTLLTIFILLSALFVFLFLKYKGSFFETSLTRNGTTDRQFSVAILTPVTHPSLEKIEAAFRSYLANASENQYDCTTFNANGNKSLLHAQAEEISNSSYDLIFTIATQPTLIMKEISTKKKLTTPIVFAAADQPIENRLVQSYQNPGGTMTGVYEHNNFDLQVALLLLIKPAIKKVLIVYNPSQAAGLEQYKSRYEAIFLARNISVDTLEIFQTNEVYQKVSTQLGSGYDLVLVMKDNTVVPAIDSIIKLCSMHHVTLYASDLDSGYKGAALSFGVKEEAFGAQAAMLTTQIIEQGKNPATLACVTPGKEYFLINTKTAESQGILLTKEQLLLFSHLMTTGG